MFFYACHLAGRAPGTNLGAATPVQLGGGPQPIGGRPREGGDDEGGAAAEAHTAKAVNDAVVYIRGLAELHGRNAEWAERAGRSAASLSAKAALEQGVSEILAADLEDLLRQADGRVVRVGNQGGTSRPQAPGSSRSSLIGASDSSPRSSTRTSPMS
jgi:membrane-bound serine protease (ClpP class)